jgi:ABC-type proline/glycine betaine transport system substrate-binding protein
LISSALYLLENGYKVSLNTVTRYRQELGLKAVLAVKQVNDTLEKHPHPEIFNTDQGAQCTSEIHTQRLKKLISPN